MQVLAFPQSQNDRESEHFERIQDTKIAKKMQLKTIVKKISKMPSESDDNLM